MISGIINFVKYRRLIEKNKEELSREFGVKIDNLYRLGTIVSISSQKLELMRNYKNSELDIHKELDVEVRRIISKMDRYFMQKNLIEYIGLYDVQRVGENLVTLVMSYRLLGIVKFAKRIRIVQVISILSLFCGFFGLMYMIPGASIFLLMVILNSILFKKLFI